jgi:hypothetical protein
MKPSSRDQQLGLASPLNYAAIQSGKTKNPSNKEEMEAGAGCQAHTAFREGREENFFLTSSFTARRSRNQTLSSAFSCQRLAINFSQSTNPFVVIP